MAEEPDDPLDRLLHAVEFGEGRIAADGPVGENPAKPRITRGVDDLGLADRSQQALGRAAVHPRIAAALLEIRLQRDLGIATLFEMAE